MMSSLYEESLEITLTVPLIQTELIPGLVIEDLVMEKGEEGGEKDEKENDKNKDSDLSRRYNLN